METHLEAKDNPNRSSHPGWAATYHFAGKVEQVTLLKILRDGSALIAHRNGSLNIVAHHRVRLSRRDLS